MVMPPIELRAIEVFLALSEELHFARTAERVGLTPSRVSQIIRHLERQAGGALFERTSRHVRPTARGMRLHRDLAPAYALIDQAFAAARLPDPVPLAHRTPPDQQPRAEEPAAGEAVLRPVATDPAGPLRLGMSGWTNDFQQRLVSALTLAASPRAVVTVPSDSTRSRVEGVLAGSLDVAFVRLEESPAPALAYRSLVTEPLLLAVPAEHPLARRPAEPAPVPLSALNGEPLAFYHRDQNPWWYDDVVSRLASVGAEPRIVHRGLWHFDVVSLVRAGTALALLTPTAAASARLEGVVYRRLAPAVLSIGQGLVWRREPGGELDALVEALMHGLPARAFG